MELVFDLPVPPSANRVHTLRGNRPYRSKEYRTWLKSLPLQFQPVLPAKTPIEVWIEANISRNRDLDNVVKPTLDGLQQYGIIPDDRWVDRNHQHRVTGNDGIVSPGWIRVRLKVI